MKLLSKRQKDVLAVINSSIARNGYPPSVREIAAELKVSSAAGVHKHINALVKKGALSKSDHLSRSLKPLNPSSKFDGEQDFETIQVPLIGKVAAGFPVEAVSHIQDYLPVAKAFLQLDKQYFILTVVGDSMIDEGILDGDFVVLESRKEARNGEVVVALIRGQEATLKRLQKDGAITRLIPANKMMDSILVPSEDVQIQGVVATVLRKYQTP